MVRTGENTECQRPPAKKVYISGLGGHVGADKKIHCGHVRMEVGSSDRRATGVGACGRHQLWENRVKYWVFGLRTLLINRPRKQENLLGIGARRALVHLSACMRAPKTKYDGFFISAFLISCKACFWPALIWNNLGKRFYKMYFQAYPHQHITIWHNTAILAFIYSSNKVSVSNSKPCIWFPARS